MEHFRCMPKRQADSPGREAARSAGLRYVQDERVKGITRQGSAKRFHYLSPAGKAVRDAATLKRIRALAIPPAWRQVWIAPSPDAHLQAAGRDAKGRKQYRYHPDFVAIRDADKYAHLVEFAQGLPALRRRLKTDLKRKGMPREKVLAGIVTLLEETLIRVGNEDYARQNHSYGLTTLRNSHVKVRGGTLRFLFTGKSGKRWDLSLRDRRIANIVRACQELPGQHLFEYRDGEGGVHPVTSTDVNAYLKEISGKDITAKDFRTWAGTVEAAKAFAGITGPATKKSVRQVVAKVAARLGNTVAVCRKCYIHPAVIEAFEEGRLRLPPRGRESAVLRLVRAGVSKPRA
jgi:DNA topoisomerase-1